MHAHEVVSFFHSSKSRPVPWRQAPSSCLGSSLLPTIVKFIPICTATGVPPTSIVVLPLRYQPREPVENSFTMACIGTLLIATDTGLALARNSERLTGQVVLAMKYLLAGYSNRPLGAANGGMIPFLTFGATGPEDLTEDFPRLL